MKRLFVLSVLFVCLGHAAAFGRTHSGSVAVRDGSRTNNVDYIYYVPDEEAEGKRPVLIGVGGLNASGDQFMDPYWTEYAASLGFAVVGLGFKFVDSDWAVQRSYQYPAAWSGWALIKILNKIAEKEAIDTEQLYLFGISAGAQFVTRFALMNPKVCRAVAAHAAGGYGKPVRDIETKFLITVGALDNTDISRVSFAEQFVRECRGYGIYVEYQVIPDLAHQHSDLQNEMSRDFFKRAYALYARSRT